MIKISYTKLKQIGRQPGFYKQKTEFQIKKWTATEEAVLGWFRCHRTGYASLHSCARWREAVQESSRVEFLCVFRHISKSCFVWTKLPSNRFFLRIIFSTQSKFYSVVYIANSKFFTESFNRNMNQFRLTITGGSYTGAICL